MHYVKLEEIVIYRILVHLLPKSEENPLYSVKKKRIKNTYKCNALYIFLKIMSFFSNKDYKYVAKIIMLHKLIYCDDLKDYFQ